MARKTKEFWVLKKVGEGSRAAYHPVAAVTDGSDGEKWMKENGEDGAVYVVASMGLPVTVSVEKVEKRAVSPVEETETGVSE